MFSENVDNLDLDLEFAEVTFTKCSNPKPFCWALPAVPQDWAWRPTGCVDPRSQDLPLVEKRVAKWLAKRQSKNNLAMK